MDDLIGNVKNIDSILEDVTEIESEVYAIKSVLAFLEPQVPFVGGRIEIMSLSVADIDSKTISHEIRLSNISAESRVNMVIKEISMRSFRAKNVLVFGLSESKRVNVEDKVIRDKARFQTIVTAVDSVIVTSVTMNPSCLAKLLETELKSTFRAIIKAATKDLLIGLGEEFPGSFVARDITTNETTHPRHLGSELTRRLESGEDNHKIKYISGPIKIIQSKTQKVPTAIHNSIYCFRTPMGFVLN